MPLVDSNPARSHPHIAQVSLPTPEQMIRRLFQPDAVAWMGATDMNDGRTMLVFEADGCRRAIAIRGSIQELTHEQTEREIEWTRQRHLHAEACLETIYRPSAGGNAPSLEARKQEAPTDEAEPAFLGDSTAHEEVVADRLGPLPGQGATPSMPEVEMPPLSRGDVPVIDDETVEPIPGYLGNLPQRPHWMPSDHREVVDGWED